MIDKYKHLKKKNPDRIFFFFKDDNFHVFNEDAERLAEISGFEIIQDDDNLKHSLVAISEIEGVKLLLSEKEVEYELIDYVVVSELGFSAKRLTLKYLLSVLAIVVFGVLLYFFSPLKTYVIVTDSMEPVINVRDLVFVNRYKSLDKLNPEDIIAFEVDINNDGNKEVVVHYIDEIRIIDGIRSFKTHPEGETSADPWELSDEDIIGEYLFRIPKIGNFIMFIKSPIGLPIIVIDLVVIYYIIYYFKKED